MKTLKEVIYLVFALSLFGCSLYVTIHFIRKFW